MHDESPHPVLSPPMVPLFEPSKRVMSTIVSPIPSSELLCCLGRARVDRAEDILSELRKQGYLDVGGDGWWKVDVLIRMMSRGSINVLPFPLFLIKLPDRVHH